MNQAPLHQPPLSQALPNPAPSNQAPLDHGLSPLPGSAAVLHHLQSAGAFAAYAGAEAPVETIETHMSWVFLVGEHVLKLKKPVRFPSLDFSTIGAREACCREEVRLNSRLAPGIYLGLMAVQWRAGRLAVVPEALALEDGVILDLAGVDAPPAEDADAGPADCRVPGPADGGR